MIYKSEEPQDDSIVPFGKYRGQPVEVMLADSGYLEWILGQPGIIAMLQSRHPAFFNVIMVGAPATDDSPVHNVLQARFLDSEFQLAFLEVRLGQSVYGIAAELAEEAAAKAAEILAEAISIARQDDIDSTKALEEIEKKDAEIKSADWNEHYCEERNKYLENQREEECKINEKARSLHSWSVDPRYYLEPFPDYEQWTKKTGDWSSWPGKVKRHHEEIERTATRQIKDREIYQTVISIAIKAPEPAKPVVEELEFECGFDVRIKFGWSYEISRLWESCYGTVNSLNPRKWVQRSSRSRREDQFKIEIKPQMGDDFPSVLRQMKRNGADTLVIDTFESSVCTLDQVRQIFGYRAILTFAQIEAVRKRGWHPITACAEPHGQAPLCLPAPLRPNPESSTEQPPDDEWGVEDWQGRPL
jgi:hypothetical protein